MARPLAPLISAPSPAPEHELLLSSEPKRAVWVDMGVAILFVVAADRLTLTLLFTVVALADLSAGLSQPALQRALFLPMLMTRTITVLFVVLAVLHHRGQSLRAIGLAASRIGIDILCGAGAVGAAFVAILICQYSLLAVWPELFEEMEENAQRIMSAVPRLHNLGLIGVALAVAVYEEVLFRGFLMPRLRRATNSWTAAVVSSSTVFVALHALDQKPAALLPIAILSLTFSLVGVWRLSIIPAIVGHFMFNAGSFLVLSFLAGDTWN